MIEYFASIRNGERQFTAEDSVGVHEASKVCLGIMSYLILGLSAILADLLGRPDCQHWLELIFPLGKKCAPSYWSGKILPIGNILLSGAYNPDNITER